MYKKQVFTTMFLGFLLIIPSFFLIVQIPLETSSQTNHSQSASLVQNQPFDYELIDDEFDQQFKHFWLHESDRQLEQSKDPQMLVPTQSHPRIEINNDTDFTLQGWPGSGTQIDPFRIENLNFNPLQFHDDCIKIHNTTVHFIIQNCTFLTSMTDGSGWWYAGIILDKTTNAIIRNNTFSSQYGIELHNANRNQILNNTLDDNRVSVVLSNSSYNTIMYNNGSGTYGIEMSYRSISNLIHMNSLGYQIAGISIKEFEGTVVTNNSLLNSGFSIYAIQSPFPGFNQSQFQGNTLNGKPIFFLLDQDSSALSMDAGQLFLFNCSNTEMSNNILTVGPLTIAFYLSDNITIQNNEFLGTEGQFPGFILLNCETIQIRNNTFYRTDGFYLEDCKICELNNNSFLGEDVYGGISIHDSQFCTISENNLIIIYVNDSDTISITQNWCESILNPWEIRTRGIWVEESNLVKIQDNTCTNCRYGVQSVASTSIITNNTCFDNLYFGIYLEDESGGLIENNMCRDNGHGIYANTCQNMLLKNNTCTNNSGSGLYLTAVTDFHIIHNYCSNNGDGIIITSSSADSLVTHNNCSGNIEVGISLRGVRQITLSNNYCKSNREAGVKIGEGSLLTIINNTCSENNLGITIVSETRSINITRNALSQNIYGISITGDCRTSNITENLCSENQIGLFIHNLTRHCHVFNNQFLWNRNVSVLDDGFYGVFDGNFWSDYVGWDLNFDGYGDIPYVIPGRAESLDFRPRGFILTRSLQIWMLILLVVGVLVVVAVIGLRFFLTPQQRKRFFRISR